MIVLRFRCHSHAQMVMHGGLFCVFILVAYLCGFVSTDDVGHALGFAL